MANNSWRDADPSAGGSSLGSTAPDEPWSGAPEIDGTGTETLAGGADVTSDVTGEVVTIGGEARAIRPDTDDPWASYEPLYDEHHDRLYRVAVLLCAGNTADAEDAVAETFIRVHRAWLGGRVDDFFPYARQSLVNHIMARFRRQKTARKYLPVTAQSQVQRDRPVDDAVVDSEIVLQALDRLSPRRRTAVVLRYFEDLPYQEIADAMGVALGTAKAQVSTGLDQLRRALEAKPGAEQETAS